MVNALLVMRVEKTSPLPPHGIQRTHCQTPQDTNFDFFPDSQFFALVFFSDPLYCSYHWSLVWLTSTAGDRGKPLCAFMSAAEFISRQQQGTGTSGVFLPSLPDAPPANNLNKK